MPKSTTITQEVIIGAAFEMMRKEGFAVLSTRNIVRQIGCSIQPIYWCYRDMDDLKAEICKKALSHLQNVVLGHPKTGSAPLDLGLEYVRITHIEPALFKAFYMDNVTSAKLIGIFPENRRVVEIIKNSEECRSLSFQELEDNIARA